VKHADDMDDLLIDSGSTAGAGAAVTYILLFFRAVSSSNSV
jgi:hypothetical protein